MDPIYLDYNASTPVSTEVKNVIYTTLDGFWANPNSLHSMGMEAKKVIEDARKKVATMISAQSDEIFFTSGGTETCNMVINTAIKYFYSYLNTSNNSFSYKPHIITTNIEYFCMKLLLEELVKRQEIDVTFVSVSTATGMVSITDIEKEIRPNTCLISVILANNITGFIQPVESIKSRVNKLKKSGHIVPDILVHTDAAQAIGKIEVNVHSLDVDYMCINGNKFYGPCIGALYSKQNSPLYPLLYGGHQEQGYRPGIQNTCMIAGLGKAAELVTLNLTDYHSRMKKTRDYLEDALKMTFKDKVLLNNERVGVKRLPNTVNAAFNYEEITGDLLLKNAPKLCASAALAGHLKEFSSILIASGMPEYLALRTVRFSVGLETTKKDIDNAIKCLETAIKTLINN